MANENRTFVPTELEARILRSVEQVGWFTDLWFPKVDREELNFGSRSTDEEVLAAFVSLVRKGALVETHDHPEWQLAPGAIEAAVSLLKDCD